MTVSQQTYLKTIYLLLQRRPDKDSKVLSVDVAQELSVSRSSVCKAMKILFEKELVQQDYQSEVQLTEKGLDKACSIVARELIVSDFFQKTLDLSLEQAGEYASVMVHVLDSDTVARMKNAS